MIFLKLLFKQRLFSWFDSYNVYDTNGDVVYTIKGQLAWGHCFKIFDANGNYLATVKQRILTFLSRYDLYMGDKQFGCITKEFTFFRPKFNIDFNGWRVEGNFWEWDYDIVTHDGAHVATVSKEVFNLTDTYTIDVERMDDALYALMLVVAIDAEKCSRDN